MRKYIAQKLHNLAYWFHTETIEELRAEFFRLKGGKEEYYCTKCDCFCGACPCKHTLVK